ncbi:MAG: hypothetical protein LBU18_02835 [Treponema sp.]|jgi:hypothetical protein|nr:hypothetical protein [Treponema sp.]
MKSVLKFVFAALVLFCVSFLTACGEYGGTIIVKNNLEEEVEVTVYSDFLSYGLSFSYNGIKYGPETIAAGSSADFSVKENFRYGIVWKRLGVDNYKTVDVSNGDTVEVSIP